MVPGRDDLGGLGLQGGDAVLHDERLTPFAPVVRGPGEQEAGAGAAGVAKRLAIAFCSADSTLTAQRSCRSSSSLR
nr:hypothetical protein GCM10020093_057550 [Planobispora longispora]